MLMSSVIIYDPNDTLVPNRVLSYLLSANTPDYADLPNALINPVLSGLVAPAIYWKVDNGSVVGMTQDERSKIDDLMNAETIKEKKYCVSVYNALGGIQSETWYNVDKGQGVYEGKVEESIYEYLDNSLLSKTTTTYYFDGSQCEKVIETYYSDGASKLIVKKN